MAPPTTTRRLLMTSLLIMMLTTTLARANSCANETDKEAVSFNPTIQIFTSSGPEPHLNDTTETRVLDALERMETGQDELTAALASLQTQQGELTAALTSLQSKQDKVIAALIGQTPRDCSDVLAAGNSESGVYLIRPTNAPITLRVYCDMTTDGGGWTIFQRRQNGRTDFFRGWDQYKWGFGDIEDEFWIGNDALHLLTNDRAMKLRIDLWSFDDDTAYAKYSSFSISVESDYFDDDTAYAEYSSFSVSDESDYYRLEVGGYQGTAGDAMAYHNGQAFSTYDEDHDYYSRMNCAPLYHGAWWYKSCRHCSLNGRYYDDGDSSEEEDGIVWYNWKESFVSLKKTEMKVRPL